uniref:BURP domain-containing protein n=2 Tax=Chenopodium quinoa TaxID=63459 RepID=A0A803LBW5_CHEQI
MDTLLSHGKASLNSLNGYIGLLSYNNKESLISSNPRYLSYDKQGLDSSNPNYLSYKKQGLDSNNPEYLSYNKQGLVTVNSYGGLLAYNKLGPHFDNKQGLVTTNSYGALLSYDKKNSHLDNKEGLVTTNSYGGLLAYNKKGQHIDNKQSLVTTNGYDGLLSYNKKGQHIDNKQGLVTTNSYGRLLAYNKKRDINKQGLVTTNSYGGLLAYNKKGIHVDNSKSSHVDDDDANSATKDQFFFVEKDLYLGKKMTLHFQKSTRKGLFLPRVVSNQIPFSSDKVQETLKILSLDPKSKEAYVLSKRIELCEEPTIEGVEKKCVTSLESMVDYVISMIGTNVKALTTRVEKDSTKEYTIKELKKLVKDDHETVVCHKMGYPYAVFFCHRTKTIRSYMASLVGKDGTKIEAVVACHMESNDFLDNYAKNVLKIVPGSTHICHFPPAEDTVIWVPK